MSLRLNVDAWHRLGSLGVVALGLMALGACASSEPALDPPAPSPFLATAPEPTPPPAAPSAPIVSGTPAPLAPATPPAAAPAKPPAATAPKPTAAAKPAAAPKPAAATAAKPPAATAAKPPAVAPAAQAFHQCRDEALALDERARSAAAAALYREASERAAKCEIELGRNTAAVPLQERMSLAAIALLDAVKGGDGAAAQDQLRRFKARFAGQDLALADGSSFLDTIELIVSGPEGDIGRRHAQRSVSPAVRRELLRARYWARN